MMNEDDIRSFLSGRAGGETGIKKVKFPPLRQPKGPERIKTSLSHLEEALIELSVELGQVTLSVRDVLSLGEGSVLRLEKLVGENVEVIMNGKRFATGEVIVVNDSFGVRISSVNSPNNLKLSEGLV